MGKIVLFADHSNDKDEKFNFGKEFEAIDQYPADGSQENTQIFVCTWK